MQRLIDHLKAEFREMPGLQLTAVQVQRLCGIEAALCQAALDALVESEFLQVVDGRYARRSDMNPPLRTARAHLDPAHASKRAS